jgi:hypothetical protein
MWSIDVAGRRAIYTVGTDGFMSTCSGLTIAALNADNSGTCDATSWLIWNPLSNGSSSASCWVRAIIVDSGTSIVPSHGKTLRSDVVRLVEAPCTWLCTHCGYPHERLVPKRWSRVQLSREWHLIGRFSLLNWCRYSAEMS